MIHAFVAGFAGAIGVLVALWCWNRMAAWHSGKASRQEQRRLIAAKREHLRRSEQQERERRHLIRQRRGDWPPNIFGWLQVSLSVVFYLALVGGVISALIG